MEWKDKYFAIIREEYYNTEPETILKTFQKAEKNLEAIYAKKGASIHH